MAKNQEPGKEGRRPARKSGGARLVLVPWIPILHVDDDSNDRELLLAATLEAAVPFRVHSVSDAEQAIAFLSGTGTYADRRRFPLPRLILLDLKMPGSTGIDILRWVRTHPELSRTPVIILSGSESEEDMRQAYACGADAYAIKPLGFNALVEMIKRVNLGWCLTPQNASPEINRDFPLRLLL